MATSENTVEVLNNLIEINNDRIEGYNRAIKESEESDVDLKAIFARMADESKQYLAELTREVVKLGGEPESGTTASGKLYRAWMDVKATFTGSDRHTVLASCEFGEDVAQKAYKAALDTDEELTPEVRQLIANQKASLKISHDTIKKYRDMHKDVDSGLSNSADSLGTTGSTDSLTDTTGLNTTGNTRTNF